MLKKLRKPGAILLFLYIIYKLIPVPAPGFRSDYSSVIRDRSGQILRIFLNKKQQYCFPAEKRFIPEKLMKSILMYEDKYFFYHPGVNPVSLIRAVFDNLLKRRVVSGASTITMQVIRIWGKKKRTILNKFAEIFQALKLDLKYSKKEILQMYVNNAPYGGNLIGIEAASLRYFGKSPEFLTWNEAALLAVLPNSPGNMTPVINRKKLIEKKNKLLKKLFKNGEFSKNILEMSLKEPFPDKLYRLPFQAPHLSRFLAARYGGQGKFVDTFIDSDIQSRVSGIFKRNMEYLNTLGISNGAVVIAETKSGKIRAYCGSKDFFDDSSFGQVDGVRAPRSSGSILKPFLYAMAIDEGYILGKTLIKDIPSYFGSFSPSNSGGGYDGIVTAKEALIRSLNIPAVRLLNRLGLEKFYLFLSRAGIKTLVRSPHAYGLTLVLGGAETRLLDLLKLYRSLGNHGDFSDLKIVKSNKIEKSGKNELISSGAAFLILNMLKELKRPGAEYYWQQYTSRNPIGWKTGTSYGQRDAWSVGVNPSWTIAVWVGNFSGEGNNNLGGASCAAPIMFDIFNSLPKIDELKWFKKKDSSLKKVELCSDTGYLSGTDCQKTVISIAPSGSKSLKICPFHKTIYTTLTGEERVCSLCWKQGDYKRTKILFYPPDVSQFLRENGNILPFLPPHKPDCPSVKDYNPIKIIYPVNNARILIPRDFNGEAQKVTFKAASAVRGRKIYWYIDRKYYGYTSNKHKLSITSFNGKHRLEIIDQEGNRASVNFFITLSIKKK